MGLPLPEDLSSNSSFSRASPGLQLAVDSTSLGAFKFCPRFYYYSILWGWQPRAENHHFKFGLLLHEGREAYDRARASGADHPIALRAAVRGLLISTWDSALGRPQAWGDNYKNRGTALRSLVWYLDAYGGEDPLETVQLADGRPAVELSFSFNSGHWTSEGEEWIFCGHLDRLVLLNGTPYVSDLKTTSGQLNQHWLRQFTPHNQFTLYLLAAQLCFATPADGLIVDGLRVLVNATEMRRLGPVQRDRETLEEWLRDSGIWLRRMEEAVHSASWPMNEQSCNHYQRSDGTGGCPFREVCSRAPRQREAHLRANFARRVWDPLRVRGDV